MSKLITAILIFLGMAASAQQYPEARISNQLIDVHLYLPDSENGFYRATRFDWAGVISSLKYKGHEYFGQWYNKHDPTVHDAIQGPVEAFDPIGYDEAKAGDPFLKIGVGVLKKANDAPYRFSTKFVILNGGKWKIKTKKDRVEFTHALDDPMGYSYIYKKTVRLAKDKPELVLEHTLKNTGRKTIDTRVFDHNFFMIDHQKTGPDFSITLPFDIESTAAAKNLMTFKDNKMFYLRELADRSSTMEYPKGFKADQTDYDIRIENSKTGGAVRITSDKPLADFMFWSIPTVLSPEPFIKVTAAPGEEFKWEIKYQFYEVPISNK